MDRRTFLRSAVLAAGMLGGGSVLAACAGGGGGGDEPPSGDPTLSVITGSYEILRGSQQTLAFGVRTTENTPVEDETVTAWLRDADGDTILDGPLETTYTEDAGAGLGVYLVTVDLSTENVPEGIRPYLVAAVGGDWGEAALNVVSPEESQLPVPGDEAIAVPTPTTADALGYGTICTQDPACGMHEISLDEALAAGRPVVLLFATPAYCQTAVCGPSVDTLEEIAQSRDWGDIAFIHAEIFSDAGETVTNHVRAWNLPSEPWLFTIDSEGRIVRRLDGPMIGDELRDAAEELLA